MSSRGNDRPCRRRRRLRLGQCPARGSSCAQRWRRRRRGRKSIGPAMDWDVGPGARRGRVPIAARSACIESDSAVVREKAEPNLKPCARHSRTRGPARQTGRPWTRTRSQAHGGGGARHKAAARFTLAAGARRAGFGPCGGGKVENLCFMCSLQPAGTEGVGHPIRPANISLVAFDAVGRVSIDGSR